MQQTQFIMYHFHENLTLKCRVCVSQELQQQQLNRCRNMHSLDLSLILRMSFDSYPLERGRALYAG